PSTAWRDVNPNKVLADARSALVDSAHRALDALDDPARADEIAEVAAGAKKRGRGRPSRYSDPYVRLIAMLYLRLQKDGFTRGILDEVARRLGVDRERARDLVHLARKRGYLTKGTPGRAGADPGPRLLREFASRNLDPLRRK